MKRVNDCPRAWASLFESGRLVPRASDEKLDNWEGSPRVRVRLVRETERRRERRHLAALERTVTAQEQAIDRLRAEVAKRRGGVMQPRVRPHICGKGKHKFLGVRVEPKDALLAKGETLLRYAADDEIAAERAYVHLERMDTGIFDLHVNDRQFVLESARKITLRDFDEKGKA